MIRPAERVVVGVSGGKDSVGLLYLLWWQRRLYRLSHDLVPVRVIDVNDTEEAPTSLERWIEGLNLSLITVRTELHPPGGDGLSPCFLCTWHRKRALFETAEQVGSSVIALGHHSDDVAVTALMNLFFQGRFDGITPCQSYFKGKFRLIRPLYFVSERALVRMARVEALPVHHTPCVFAGASKRAEARSWLETIVRDQPSAKRSLLGALHRQALARAGRPCEPPAERRADERDCAIGNGGEESG